MGTPTNYFKFYLPILLTGDHLYRSQSITMTGVDIIKVARSDISQLRINVTYNSADLGFDATFFNFDNTIDNYHASETIIFPDDDSVVEFYIGKVIVTLGKV